MKLSGKAQHRRMVSHCPCGKPNKNRKGQYRFVPYLSESEEIVTGAGYCHSCGQTFRPQRDWTDRPSHARPERIEPPKTTYAPQEVVDASFQSSPPILGQLQALGFEVKALDRYFIGEYAGDNALWLHDRSGGCVTAQVQGFDADLHNTGSKYLHGIHRPPWAKSDIIPAFGEHLLKRDGHAMVVEAAKTALIMTCLFPQSTWIATLGASRLNAFLKRNRDVQFILFPDNDLPGKNWVDIANRDGHKVCTSFWEKCRVGDDVADVVLRNRLIKWNRGNNGN